MEALTLFEGFDNSLKRPTALPRTRPFFIYMEYDIKSKPTIYRGTKYRSRLEARWAAMFDLLGWRYQYEPFDLPGWTPDFQVFGSNGRYILFEIKPFLDEDVLWEYYYKIKNAVNIHGESEFELKPACIISSAPVPSEYSPASMLSAGYQITPWGRFEVHWKDNQTNAQSQYDIGSALMSFDGILWNDAFNRKIFIDPDNEHFNDMWIKSGELSRFHYHG